jgi:23S rRNA pseudouridine955/2504/2580 synthase
VERAIVHEDEKFMALDKPAGLAVHGGSGLSFGVIEVLRAARPDETLELAHRLDRDTSGILLVSRRPSSLRALHALLRDGAVEKRYLVLVRGRWELGHKMIDVPLRTDTRVGGERTVRAHASGKPARTEFLSKRSASRVEAAATGGSKRRCVIRWRATPSTAMRSSTPGCASSDSGGCSCTHTAAPLPGRAAARSR